MRSLLRSLLGIFQSGEREAGSSTPAAPADVTLIVPGMHWASGWPDRVRRALGTLPWVEQGTIQTVIAQREVRFNLKDKAGFNAEDVRAALKAQGFPEVGVKEIPAW